jgi:hypothetical protein
MTMAADTAEKVMTDAHNRILRFHNERDQAATTRRYAQEHVLQCVSHQHPRWKPIRVTRYLRG